MAEPFKNLIDAALVRAMGRHLQRAGQAFDRRRFERLALDGLDDLELKARAMHIASALERTLPADFAAAADLLERSLAPVDLAADPAEGSVTPSTSDEGLAGWAIWPMGEYVARRGMDQPDRALAALHALTQRLSAEFAIRPFIVRHPARVFDTLARWCRDPSAHVRRLVSEGSRPRLPWGLRLQALVADPSPTLPLLRTLMDDPSAYVRRSVANHLNDIGKDHPDLVVAWVREHLPADEQAGAARRALLRHASRSLVKQGHAGMLAAWGLGAPLRGKAALTLDRSRVKLGESLPFTLALQSTSTRAQVLEIDYAVHHVKADGSLAPKVFKGWRIELAARAARTLEKRHSLRPVTTRTYRAGRHLLDVRINGQVVAEKPFDLRVPTSPARVKAGATSPRRRSPR
jgi:3-methyladenine DNA glycosylase AlkC